MNKKIQKTGWKEKGWWRKLTSTTQLRSRPTTLTGEETTVLRKTGSRVERSFLLVRGTDRWTLVIQICLLADISSKEKEMSLKVTRKVTLSCHSLSSCQPAPTYSYQMKGPACRGHTDGGSSCGGRACVKPQWLLHVGTLPGSTKGRGVGFLSENVYQSDSSAWGWGSFWHEGASWSGAQRMSWSWLGFRALVSGAVRTGVRAAMVKAELECWGHLESCFRLERSLDSLHSGGLHCLEWRDFLI